MNEIKNKNKESNIIISDYSTEMRERYLEYAMSVVAGRALPNVQDGLKPVHRRILYSMYELGLTPDKGYRKCARIVGDVLGKYHPHGDTSVYDALVRMAQDWNLRYPLVDGHGNFGSVDGDSAAAMRYCVTGDTLINTNKGLTQIKDIVPNSKTSSETDIDIKIESINHIKNKGDKFFNSGIHSIIQLITTYNYQIKGSYNHPLLTLTHDDNYKPIYKWKLLQDIKKGDYLILNRSINQIQSNINNVNKKTAMFLGGMVSEGYISNKNQKYYRIGFANKNIQFIEDMKDAFVSLFPENFINENFNKKTNSYDIYIHSKKKYSEFINKYNFIFGSKNKEVPKLILSSSLNIQSIFLKYLFEGDGCPCKKSIKTNPFIAYSSSSLKLLRQIQTILLQFGIISAINKDKKNSYRLHIHGKRNLINFQKYINFAYTKKRKILNNCIRSISDIHSNSSKDFIPYISQYIRQKYNNTWLNKNNFDRLESFIKNKNKLINIISKQDYNLLNELLTSGYIYLQVNKKTFLDPEIVYSIKVNSNCHSFTGNGFINHNTEAKLSKLAMEMLKDINKNIVDFRPNFDGEEKEPCLLPSRFPNLLTNGTEGIAVGMATSIPPHNLNEIINGLIYLINNTNTTIKEINKYILCPDFPTGGTIINPNNIEEIYNTGQGSITIRGKYHIENNMNDKKKHIKSIIFTEIPYQTNKEKIYISIINLVNDKEPIFDDVLDIRDESDREGMRLVIDIKYNADENKILYGLFKKTQLQKNYNATFCVLVNNEPKILNLKQLMQYYIDFQKEIIIKRTNFNLHKKQIRLHVLEGLLIAINTLDLTIQLIRNSKNKNEAKNKLIKQLNIDNIQAQAILELKLERLTNLESTSINKEYEQLRKEIIKLNSILHNKNKLSEVLKEELLEIKDKYGDKRRTKLLYNKDNIKEIKKEDLIKNYSVTMVLTKQQYLKKTLKYSEDQKLKENDETIQILQTNNTKDLLLFTNQGRVFTRKIYQLTGTIECTAKGGYGEYLPNILQDNLNKNETIIYIASPDTYEKGFMLYIFANNNIVKMAMKPYECKQHRQVAQEAYNTDSPLKYIQYIDHDINILTLSSEGKMLIQNTKNIKPKTSNGGKKSIGNSFIKLNNHKLIGVIFEPKENDIIKFKTEKRKYVEIILSDICQSSKNKTTYYKYCIGNKNTQGNFIYNCRQKQDKLIKLL